MNGFETFVRNTHNNEENGPITKGLITFCAPQAPQQINMSHTTLCHLNEVLKHFSNILRGLTRGIQIFCLLHFCDVAEVAIIHTTV
jgi:hypothetical protein